MIGVVADDADEALELIHHLAQREQHARAVACPQRDVNREISARDLAQQLVGVGRFAADLVHHRAIDHEARDGTEHEPRRHQHHRDRQGARAIGGCAGRVAVRTRHLGGVDLIQRGTERARNRQHRFVLATVLCMQLGEAVEVLGLRRLGHAGDGGIQSDVVLPPFLVLRKHRVVLTLRLGRDSRKPVDLPEALLDGLPRRRTRLGDVVEHRRGLLGREAKVQHLEGLAADSHALDVEHAVADRRRQASVGQVVDVRGHRPLADDGVAAYEQQQGQDRAEAQRPAGRANSCLS